MVHRTYSLVFRGTSLVLTHKFIDCLTFTEDKVITATLMSALEFALASMEN